MNRFVNYFTNHDGHRVYTMSAADAVKRSLPTPPEPRRITPESPSRAKNGTDLDWMADRDRNRW